MLSVLVILSFILTPLAVFFPPPVSAADASSDSSDYKQKIVAVVYDNSGSMGNGARGELASYSVKMLMALLDERDTLFILPMNKANGTLSTGLEDKVEVDLDKPESKGGREQAITDAFNSGIFHEEGYGTPNAPITWAIQHLKDQYQLTDKAHLQNADPSKEYWLVVLTDGEIHNNPEEFMTDALKNYPLLNTVYLSLDIDDDSVYNLKDTDLDKGSERFTGYCATQDSLVQDMQDIANKLSGRYTLPKDFYSANNNTVTIRLSENVNFALSSISVIAQNCGAELLSVSYNGKAVTPQRGCVIQPTGITVTNPSSNKREPMKNTHSAILYGDPYFYQGELVLTYSAPVDENRLSIIAEPALRIEALLYKDQEMKEQIDVGYINSQMRVGDRIYVNYRAYSQQNNDEIDLAKAFGGDVEATVSYAGKNDYKVGEAIPLVLGTKDLLLTVKVLGGRYILTDSFNFVVLEKPEDFKVESAADAEFNSVTKTAKITYTIYLDGKKVTSKAQLAAYTCTATMTRPDGQTEKVTLTVNDNGTVSGAFRATVGIYGDYTVAFRIEYNDNKLVYREASDSVNFPQPVVAVTATGGGTIDPSKLESSGVFKVTENGNALTWDVLKDYTLTAVMIAPDKIETQLRYALQQDGTVTVDMDAVEGVYGTYTVVLKVVTNYGGEAEGSYTAKYVPAAADMTVVGSDHLSIRQHALKSNELGFTFELKAGTEPFVFENGLTTLKIFVDGKEMQGIIRMNGNKMTFIPHADYLKEICDTPGDKTVVVELRCDEYPQLCDSETVTLTVEQTVFAVEVFPFGTQSIDRFRLTETTAAAYFRVLRDGAPLSVQELQEALDAGKLTWDTENMGIFNLNGLSPMRTDIAVLSDSGEADASGSAVGMIAVQVSRSCLRPLDSYVSMLVMSGNKTVTLRYEDVFVSGALTVERSGAWSYIWRVLVIIFLIYLGLYIAGFFKAKAMPSGVFVRISTNGSTQSTYVNDTVWKRYGWHLLRFFQPHKLWAYQSPESQDPGCDGMKLVHTKEHPFTFMIEEGDSVYALNLVDGSPGAEMMPKLFNRLREGDEDYELKRDVRPSDVPETFEQRDEGVALREDSFATPYRWNGKYPRNGKNFLYAVYFIKF